MQPTIRVQSVVMGVLTGSMISVAAIVPAAAAPPEITPVPVAPVRVATPASSPLNVLPPPLTCLLTTGFALFCLGIT